MKKLLLAVCLTSTSAFALSMDPIDKIQNRIDEQVKIIEKSFKDQSTQQQNTIARIDQISNSESNIWSQIIDLYELYRVNGIHERYFFLLEATNSMTLPLDQRGLYLEEWAQTMDDRAYALGLSPRFYNSWKPKMSVLTSQIQDLVTNSRQNLGEQPAPVTVPTSKIKELSKSLKDLPPQIVEKEVIVKDTSNQTNLYYLLGAFLAGCSLMLIFRRRKTNETSHVQEPARVEIPALAAFEAKKQEPVAPMNFEEEITNLNLEEISKRTLRKNEHLLNLATLDVQHQQPSPFDTNVNISPEKLSDAMNWMIKGIISLKNTAINNEAKLDWVCKRNKNRVSVDFILRNVKIDVKKLQEDAIINGDGSAPAHFGRCEQILSNHYPTVKIKPTDKHTIISLGLESYVGTEITH
ncbi:MAG TPA: hypothetical protein VKZ84_03135 [Bacteriovoracaceae bacterium]|nr:hypothetical protein [Bacteriovoracaceae bacterium]